MDNKAIVKSLNKKASIDILNNCIQILESLNIPFLELELNDTVSTISLIYLINSYINIPYIVPGSWGQQTILKYKYYNNSPCVKLENLNYQGWEFSNPIDFTNNDLLNGICYI